MDTNVQALAALLPQLKLALGQQSLQSPIGDDAYNASTDFWKACGRLEKRIGPLPAPVAEGLAALAGQLSSAAVAVQRQQEASSEDTSILGTLAPYMKCGLISFALGGMLFLQEEGLLQLPEADCLRLLTAAVVPLQLEPKVLLGTAATCAAAALDASAESWQLLRIRVGAVSQSVRLVLHFLQTSQPGSGRGLQALPPRAAAVARNLLLKPQRLLLWLEGMTATCQHVLDVAGGTSPQLHAFALAMDALLKMDEVASLLQNQPELQTRVVRFIGQMLHQLMSQNARPQWQNGHGDAAAGLWHLMCILSRCCLEMGRKKHELAASAGSSAAVYGSLMQSVASALLTKPWLAMQHGGSGSGSGGGNGGGSGSGSGTGSGSGAEDFESELPAACLNVAANLCMDCMDAAKRDSAPQVVRGLARHLGSMLGALCQLAADEAASAAAAADAPLQAAPQASAMHCLTSKAGWYSLRSWTSAVTNWGHALSGILEAGMLQHLPSSESTAVDIDCAAGCLAAAQALLRLAPLLPLAPLAVQQSAASASSAEEQPGSRSSQLSVAAASLVAACGGADAVRQQGNAPSAARGIVKLSFALPQLVQQLLAVPLPASPAMAKEAFHAFSTACRYVHALGSQLKPAPAEGAHHDASMAAACDSLFASKQHTAHAVAVLDSATLAVLNVQQRLMSASAQLQEGAAASLNRVLKSTLLLYLAALPTLPLAIGGTPAEQLGMWHRRCSVLLRLLKEPGLTDLWQQLLKPAAPSSQSSSSSSSSTTAAAQIGWQAVAADGRGQKAADVVADCAQQALQAARHMALHSSPPDYHAVDTPLEMLLRAAEVSQSAAASLAVSNQLMGSLVGIARVMLDYRKTAEGGQRKQAHALLVRAWLALLELAPQMPCAWTDKPPDGLLVALSLLEDPLSFEHPHSPFPERVVSVLEGIVQQTASSAAAGDDSSDEQLTASSTKQQPRHGISFLGHGADSNALPVRIAQALAMRNCANPRCSNLSGSSEAAIRGRKCGGCLAVRYCSEACCRADWRQHKVVCKLLQQQG